MPTMATSTEAVISTQADWQAGERVNIDSTTSAGSIKMNTKTAVRQNLNGASASAENYASGNPSSMLEDTCTSDFLLVFGGADAPGDKTLTIDLGEIKSTIFFEINFGWFGAETLFYFSDNGTDWTQTSITQNEGSHCSGPVTRSSFFSGRYIKVLSPADINPSCTWGSFNIFQQSATETISIDGGENFWDWETFTDTKTVPANTSVTYRYRSSANGSSWNAWHSSFGDVESRSGDTKYRYLQVEATLSNTDGTSTPTIDSYSIDYHTELKPTAPTAQSAVVR